MSGVRTTDLFGISMFWKNGGSWASSFAVGWYAKQCQNGRSTRITCSIDSTVLTANQLIPIHSNCYHVPFLGWRRGSG